MEQNLPWWDQTQRCSVAGVDAVAGGDALDDVCVPRDDVSPPHDVPWAVSQGSVTCRLVTRLPPVGCPHTAHPSQPAPAPTSARWQSKAGMLPVLGRPVDRYGWDRLAKSPPLSSSSGSWDKSHPVIPPARTTSDGFLMLVAQVGWPFPGFFKLY